MSLHSLTIGSHTARFPFIQGGMGVGVSLSGLAGAVAEQGGIGVIAAAAIGFTEPDFKSNYVEANCRSLRREIQKVRSMTDGVLGVNVMVAASHYAAIVGAAVDEGVDIIFSGAGLPLSLPKYVPEGAKTALAPIVSSARAAALLCKGWLKKFKRLPDAVVVEGPKAGGHLGFSEEQIADPEYRLERLVPAVVAAVKPYAASAGKDIPVVAAGGVYSGADVHKFLQLGASGVQMGTRFVATHECDASLAFKQAFVDAKEQDVTIIKSPVGMPGRALANEFVRDVEQGGRKPFSCPYHCIKSCDYVASPYCIALALINARRGAVDKGLVFAGENAHKVDCIVSVKQLFKTLQKEYENAVLQASEAAMA